MLQSIMCKITSLPLKTASAKSPLRLAAYCRVSTVSDEQAGSLEMQKRAYADIIEQTPDRFNVDVFSDTGSGRYLPNVRSSMHLWTSADRATWI